ncbi:MAG: VCBS repeat-containing protein [Mariniblastus sp.]|nr:VCBS repeat-containing protein [Mariniblastus sp.]
MMLVVVVLVSQLTGCKRKESAPAVTVYSSPDEKLVADLIKAEDLILDLTPRLGQLATWFQEDSSGHSESLSEHLAQAGQVIGLQSLDPETIFHKESSEPEFLEIAHWPIAETATSQATDPWEASKKLGVVWDTMKFGVVSGDFINETQNEISLHTKVEAHGAAKSGGGVYGMKAHQELVFKLMGENWELAKWIQEDFFVERSSNALFREVLADVLLDKETLKKAQRSYKDEILVKSSKRNKLTLPAPEHSKWSGLTSNHIFPSVSVVDYNNDGLDDMFLTARWGPTQMLENQGDGTFVDVAKEIGLYQEFLVNCVLFVDLDNDGDKDAMMGRPMEPALYFRNDEGMFKNVTKTHSDLGRQFFISGISATDVNRDGLIDLYLSNYPPLNKVDAQFENDFLFGEEKKIYLKKRESSNRWFDLAGSSNVLLMNRGEGKLERVPLDENLSQWHRSFQAVWSDIDNDGDDDLYVCNDFAPDALLRNDTPRGAAQPIFVDVTDDLLQGGVLGSAMGASWGDFDRDGDLDLYVSNMFSKAGNRIIDVVGDVDPRMKASSAGNFLFENNDGVFNQIAGQQDKQFKIDRVGWSYGGQWADFNNDGELDLYVPSGFYTAPPEIAAEVDL